MPELKKYPSKAVFRALSNMLMVFSRQLFSQKDLSQLFGKVRFRVLYVFLYNSYQVIRFFAQFLPNYTFFCTILTKLYVFLHKFYQIIRFFCTILTKLYVFLHNFYQIIRFYAQFLQIYTSFCSILTKLYVFLLKFCQIKSIDLTNMTTQSF